jgi:hypothetical protein
MRITLGIVLALVGVLIAVLGTVLYSVGPDGESGHMAGKGGVIFWWLSMPGYLVGTPFLLARVPQPWCAVIGGGLLWGATGILLGSLFRRRRATRSD